MSEVSASLVRDLREKTGAGMMDCKKALQETKGDFEAAVDWLRKKGLAAASKKAGRVAAEGVVAVAVQGTTGAAVEVNAETDFVARNPQFQEFATTAAKLALTHTTLEALQAAAFPGTGRSVQEELTNLIATIGENMTLRRVQKIQVSQGAVVSYVHSAVGTDMGRIGVLVALQSGADAEALKAFGKQIAMHIAAAAPQYRTTAEVDPAQLEREKAIFIDKAKATGRPDDIIQKMVDGNVRKYYEEIVLLEQAYIMDGKTKISDVVAQKAKELGQPIELTAFVRFALGEGIEKTQSDFAAEVAQMAG